MKHRWLPATSLFLILALGCAHIFMFLRFTIDDAFITFTYTRNIVKGLGPIFTLGSRVEATSSFLWAMLLVPFEAVMADGAVLGSKILGVCAVIFSIILGLKLVKLTLRTDFVPFYVKIGFCFAMLASSSFIQWSVYGMENGAVALLLLAASYLFLKEADKKSGIASACIVFLLQTIRPEGFIFIIVFSLLRAVLYRTQKPLHPGWCFKWYGLLLALLVPYETFGILYYGHLLPNTVAAKVGSLGLGRILSGCRYLTGMFGLVNILIFAVSFIFLVHRFRSKMRMVEKKQAALFLRDHLAEILLASLVMTQLSFVVLTGADWMANCRFLSHVIPLILVLGVTSFYAIGQGVWHRSRQRPKDRTAIIAAVLVSALVYGAVNGWNSLQGYKWALNLQTSEDRVLLGMVKYLNRVSNDKEDLVACADVGRMGYYFHGKVLDWWGLANEEIARSGQSCGRVQPRTVLKYNPRFVVLYSTSANFSSDAMQRGMGVCSLKFYNNAEFMNNYSRVLSLYFWPERWHILFQRKTAGT